METQKNKMMPESKGAGWGNKMYRIVGLLTTPADKRFLGALCLIGSLIWTGGCNYVHPKEVKIKECKVSRMDEGIVDFRCKSGQGLEERVKEYSINIHTEDAAIPLEWEKDSYNIQKLRPEHKDSSLNDIYEALRKYEPAIFRGRLEHVQLFARLGFHGQAYSGTYNSSLKSVYIGCKVVHMGYSDSEWNQDTFHHEFSSLVFRDMSREERRMWASVNAPGFRYGGDGADMEYLKEKRLDLRGESGMLEEGFMADYGKTGIENDFNLFAANFFNDPSGTRALALRYGKVKAKLDIMFDVYERLSGGRMDRRYFQRLR